MEKLICRIYEGNILGKLPDDRFLSMSQAYESEKADLQKQIDEIENELAGVSQESNSADKFISLVEKYETFDELTNPMLLELVDKVLVHERDRKGSIQTTQEIEIYFNFVGKFIPPDFEKELTEEEIAEMKRMEEIKDKCHQAYLRRKESGWQAKYDAKQKAKKKAQMDKKKNAIRQEYIKKGIFIPVSSMPEKEPRKVVQA